MQRERTGAIYRKRNGGLREVTIIKQIITENLATNFYGFEINKEFYRRAKEEMLKFPEERQLSIFDMDGVSNE